MYGWIGAVRMYVTDTESFCAYREHVTGNVSKYVGRFIVFVSSRISELIPARRSVRTVETAQRRWIENGCCGYGNFR